MCICTCTYTHMYAYMYACIALPLFTGHELASLSVNPQGPAACAGDVAEFPFFPTSFSSDRNVDSGKWAVKAVQEIFSRTRTSRLLVGFRFLAAVATAAQWILPTKLSVFRALPIPRNVSWHLWGCGGNRLPHCTPECVFRGLL